MSRLISTLERHEGSVKVDGRHMPYTDTVGKLTLGYGRNLTDKGISEDEARRMLVGDVQECIGQLREAFDWFDALDDARQEVLINMCFNLGIVGLSKFHSTLEFVQAGQYEDASTGMLQSKWAKQVGRRANELAAMMKTGITGMENWHDSD